MGKYKEIEGDLIKLAQKGMFDVISHGTNCFCIMGAGIAPQMANAFGCDKYPLEAIHFKGDMNKLGQIQVGWDPASDTFVINSYTQYGFGSNHADGISIPFDYDAMTMCMRKINHNFKGEHIGLPQIGTGLAGGNWVKIRRIIKRELKDCFVTVVIYKP